MTAAYEPGTVATARLNGLVRLLRYLPGDGCGLPWVMDKTYDRDDYVASNWVETDPRLVDFTIIDRPKPAEPVGRYAVVEDDQAREWVAIDGISVLYRWQLLGQSEAASEYATWGDIAAVRVVTPGVQPTP